MCKKNRVQQSYDVWNNMLLAPKDDLHNYHNWVFFFVFRSKRRFFFKKIRGGKPKLIAVGAPRFTLGGWAPIRRGTRGPPGDSLTKSEKSFDLPFVGTQFFFWGDFWCIFKFHLPQRKWFDVCFSKETWESFACELGSGGARWLRLSSAGGWVTRNSGPTWPFGATFTQSWEVQEVLERPHLVAELPEAQNFAWVFPQIQNRWTFWHTQKALQFWSIFRIAWWWFFFFFS